ncbi:MAG: flagellin, partial [Microvirga sp.]|nr:flagellin [Microvirga sp.]
VGSFTITSSTNDSNSSAGDDGSNGFITGMSAAGQDADYGSTDFGTITIDGTSIVLGSFDNNSGDDAAATQWIADRINASAVALTATRSGNQLTLSADDEGTAGNFTIEASTSAYNGFTAGQTAMGTDASAGQTDFGSLVIGGMTVELGLFDNTGKTAADAVQWILGKINGAGLDTQATALPGNQIRLTATTLGTSGNFTIDSSTSTYNGFTAGASTPGTDADAGETDFGSIFINGIEVELGTFDNNGKSAVDAAQWIIGKINHAAVPVTAGLSGNRIELTADTQGAGGSFTITTTADSNGNPSDDGTHGFSNLATATGTNASGGQTDFGSLTINGTSIVLGVLDSASYSNASAAAHLASVITAAGAGVQATVQSGRLVLRSEDSEADIVIGAVAADSNGDSSDDGAIGFLPGDHATPVPAGDASAGRTLVEGITIQVGPDAGEIIELKTPLDAYAETLGVDTSDLDVSTPEGAAETLRRIEAALSKAGDIRTSIGVTMNRVEHALATSMSAAENVSASESRIRDADVAQSILALTRSQIAALSAQAMMKHISISRANLLELLA